MPVATDSGPIEALRAWRDHMASLSRDIDAFLRGSESVFLEVGARLGGLQRRGQELLEGARAVATLDTDAGGAGPMALLQRELVRMHEYLRATSEAAAAGMTTLAQIADRAESVQRAQARLEDVPPTLRVLGLNTRIENARSRSEQAGMESVAAEVRRLGELVEPKFRAVLRQGGQLVESATAARAASAAFLERQGAWSDGILQDARGALESLHALARSEAAVASRAVAGSEELSRDLAAVVVALQAHDATRQALEHVQESLSGFADELSAAGRTPDEVGPVLARLPELCRVLSAQVAGARERFAAALASLVEHLSGLSAQGSAISDEAGRCVTSGTRAASGEQVARAVERATRSLREHVAHAEASSEATHQVLTSVEGIGALVHEIRGAGMAVKIIALNALVATERAGADGRVLSVLARGMGTVAGEVALRTAEVSSALQEIATLATDLAGSAERQDPSRGAAIAASLEELSRSLGQLQGRLAAGVAGLHQGSRGLRDEIDALAGQVRGQLAGAARLDEVAGGLERLAAEVAARAGAGHEAAGALREGAVWGRYTMAPERLIHERTVGCATVPAGVAPASPPQPEANVELF